MKFKGSKKIVSLFLAVLMVVSSVPAFALNASAAVNSTDVSALETAMSNYETKMKTGGIMTNMKAAYDAYVNAQKAIDAIKYGYSTSINVASVAANLTNATNAMTEWTAPTFTAPAYHMNNVATGAYKNVVYGPKGDTWWTPNSYNFGDSGNLFGVKVALSNNVVTCYDGTDTYIPILLQCYSQKALSLPGTRQIYKSIFSLANSNVNYTASLNHNWRFVSNVTGDIWNSPESNQNLSYTSANTAKDIARGKDCSAYNRVFLTSNNNNTYYDTIDYSNFVTTSTFYAKWIGDSSTPSVTQTGDGTAYIINYKPLKDRISTLSTELLKYNVANYTQGGLKELLSAIDACTAVNPSSYGYESNVADAVKNCGDAIKAAMGMTYSVTADNAKYQTLRDAITNADTVSTAKTADSLVAYGKAISAARNVFANDVATRGYDSPENAQAKANELNNAKSALVDVDADDAYTNFDAAVTVVNAMDTDAFIDSNTVANKVASAKAQVYTTLTDSADIEAYTLAIGTAPSGELKNSAAVDAVTKELLDFANEPSADLIKDIAVTFGAQIQKDNKEPVTAGETSNTYKYGTMVTFDANSFADVSALGDNKSIKWTVNYADKTISKFATNTTSITIKATKGMTVTANVIDETPNTEAVNYTVKLYNIYNNIVDYVYVSEPLTAGFHEGSSINVNGKAWTIDIPFYTLTGFDVAVYESSKTITVKPHYDAVNTVSVNVINGSATGNKLTDNSAVKSSSVYISTKVDNFYAWANVKDGKYQIISYNKDYGYAAISDGNYTPVVKENGTYYVYTSDSEKTELNASMIDQFKNNSNYRLSDDQYFFTKLDNYAPFTYIEDDSQSADSKYRVFIRVTSGSNDEYKKAFDSFGVYGYGSKIPFTTVNEISGQYTFTSSVLPSDFNAYVSYKMTYTDKTGSYSITTTDFAKNA